MSRGATPLSASSALGISDHITARRAYVALLMLSLTYMMSFMDRTALGVLQEPIKHEFGLSDWQLGLLGGPAFAVLYALMSLPVARLAERYSRSWVLVACLLTWSVMTLFCGAAQNYAQLLLARAGVSIGEAGSNPTSHSLIADLFPPQRRARALAIYTLGVPAGALLGAMVAGHFASLWNWRIAFVILGVSGVALAFPLLALLPSVARGRFDPPVDSVTPPRMIEVITTLFRSPVFRQFASGASLVVLVGYGVAAFLPSFLFRVHGLDFAGIGVVSGLVNGVGAGLGTLLGGVCADRFGQRDARIYGWLPAVMMVFATPCFIAGFLLDSVWTGTLLLGFATASIYTYIAPTFAQLHSMVDSRMRATAASVLFLIINLVGLGLGPPLIGLIGDWSAAAWFAEHANGNFASVCTAGSAARDVGASCRFASARGLTAGLVAVSMLLVWASVHFWLAGTYLKRLSTRGLKHSPGPSPHGYKHEMYRDRLAGDT
ncbi:MAG: MFS transporter [Pseudomonadota bacterium]|nr:MFS transporter [Pseudomonadota bacterium]